MKKSIENFDLKGKRVIIRCDFNVPMKNGTIIDDNRIVSSLRTINYAIDNGAKVILMSHLGRVKESADLAKNSLKIVADCLSELLKKEVIFVETTRGENLEKAVESLNEGDVLLVENTRYEDLENKKESGNDPELGAYWASLGDIFINDAFGTAHRSHASNVGIAAHLPSGLGFLMKKEIDELSKLNDPKRPFLVILGGAKVSDKIGVINNLIEKCDEMIIAGGMAYTFLKAQGIDVGKSIVDDESLDYALDLMKKYPDKLHLPVDFHVTTEFSNDTESRYCLANDIASEEEGLDIGPKSIENFKEVITRAKTIFWNGPVGVYEFSKYIEGTAQLLKAVTETEFSVLGGGDMVGAASTLNLKEAVSHASTGGGATLEFMEGKELPGVAAINDI